MSSDEEQERVSPGKRKRGRPPKIQQDSSPRKNKKVADDDMDGIHYACDICDQVFLHKSNYLRHSERHDPPGGFVCSLCQCPFTTEWDRNKHKRDEHSVYRCRICQAEYPLEADYNEHIQTEHEGRDCEYDMCPKCGQQFKSASQLKVHVESKCGTEKKYKCSECRALHLSQASLNTHMITEHVEKKSHQCDYCSSSFTSKDKLAVHERMHTDTKPFKCNKCDKAFARRDNLITHFLTHSGTKPYNCSYCGDRFSCIGNLLKHRRARPDTCGLPQHCVNKKTPPRPTISNLTDRSMNSNKVIQHIKIQKADKTEVSVEQDEKPIIAKMKAAQGKKTAASSDKSPEDKKPNMSKVKMEVKRERKNSESHQKMVVLKVVKSDCEVDEDDSNQSAEQDIVEICEIKIEEDGSISERQHGNDIEDESQEILFESVIEPDGTVHFTSGDGKSLQTEGYSDEEEYTDQDESDDYQPPPKYDAKGIRRTFTEKPPVITDIRSRGRMRKVKPPKPKSENIIVLDLDAQQREIDEQRSVFELNVHNISVDCYRCVHCPMQYVSPFMIGRHLENDHGIVLRELLKTLKYDREFTGERKYACRYCNRLYINEKALEKHVLLHGPDGKLLHKCTCCPRHFETPDEVRRHAVDDHAGYLQCQTCGKVFPKHCVLRKHIRQIHEGLEKSKKYHYVCPKCGKSFSSRGAVSDHERSQCGKNPIYQCEICEKGFHTASSLKIHYTVHTNELPFSCQYCGKGFRSRGQVKVHERQHTGEKPFQCEYCPKAFGHRETLHTHRSTHTGIKRYMCSGCGQRFACVSNLQCHLRSHKDTCGTVPKVSRITGNDGYHELPEGYVLPFPKVHIESSCGTEKKHKCNECNLLYLTQASLNAHMIKHAGEKRHLCDYCGANFLNKGQLKVHERMHTGEKPYKCNQCDKAFAHRESLITHSTTHSGIKPYYCSFCESRFSCIGNLLKHRRARLDTCGLPQHCMTNKIVARPNIRTMPNLTDRSVYTSKVVQRSGPPRTRKNKFKDDGSAITKKPVGRNPVKSETPFVENMDSDSSDELPDEVKPNISAINVRAQEPTSPETHVKLVDFKVEHDESKADILDDKSISKVECTQQLNNIEIVEIKIEEDDSFIEEDAYNTVQDISQEIVYETFVEPQEIVDFLSEPKVETDNEQDFDEDDSPDYQPQSHHAEKGISRTFSGNNTPIITGKRGRGRPRKIPQSKPESESIIVLDLEERQSEIVAQRQIFEENVQTISVDCYRCVHCPMQYSSSYLAGRHLEKDHQISLKELLKTLQYDRVFTRVRKYLCRYCERPYANEKALEKHVLLHGPDGNLLHKCSCCTTHFETKEEARQHAMEMHRDKLECLMCDKLFKEPESLAGHVKMYHKGQKYAKKSYYVCPKCGKAFTSRTAVSDHERSQCGKNPFYQCEMCLKCFHSAPSLKNHYTLHTKELPFSCQYCGKSYRTKGQVKVHERQHTGEKPFQCDFCPKTFAHRESLQTHRSTHTGIKRFMCSGCGQRFTCVSNLQAHKRSHKDTCGTVANVSRVTGQDGYHELPEGYILPFPKSDVVE